MSFSAAFSISRSIARVPNPIAYTSRSVSTAALPRVAQPELWQSIIPKAFRRSSQDPKTGPSKRGAFGRFVRHPSTSLILLAIFCGSQSIQLIALKSETESKKQLVERKLATLREVIDKVQNGEAINVREALGTGDPEMEKEWEDGKLYHTCRSAQY